MKLNDWKGNAVQVQGDRTYQSRGQCSCGGELETVAWCDLNANKCDEGECPSYHSGECEQDELREGMWCKKCGAVMEE